MEKSTDILSKIILGTDCYYSMDTHETKCNNNIIIVGTSGSGKTRGIVEPNLLQMTGSYVIMDPKGNLYDKYRKTLIECGYKVKKLDFVHPEKSLKYNMFKKTTVQGNKTKSNENITKLAHMIVTHAHGSKAKSADPFWDEAAEIMLSALIAYVLQYGYNDMNFTSIEKLINSLDGNDEYYKSETILDRVFKEMERKDPNSYAVRKFKSIRISAAKTMMSIQVSTNAIIDSFANAQIDNMMNGDELIIPNIADYKTALFICSSDTDRTYDVLVNIVFTQIMNSLVEYADRRPDNKLPIPVRFIMDDFATNVCIQDFPRMISSIRSREISTTIILQSESQLKEYYGEDASTILGNCDTYVYMGGGDINTAKNVSERADKPLHQILNMPIGREWIFRRGEEPIYTQTLDLDEYKKLRSDAALSK